VHHPTGLNRPVPPGPTGPEGPAASEPPARTPPKAVPFPSTLSRRTLRQEILVVLSLSLLASAVFAVIDLASAPLAGVTVAVYANVGLATQLATILFGLAPVALVLYLAERNGEGRDGFGLGTRTLARDVGYGLLAGLGVAAVGLGIYVASVALEVNRFVVPVPPLHHWWTIPILVLGAIQAALLEEVIVAGYLITRLEQLGWTAVWAVVGSAILRGSYHLYQGWGGFAGNLLLGLAFGWAFQRWRRTWPLVAAHCTVDILAGVGYILFRGHCVFGACIT
jgi:membrane protease YdiL (CAAX protease family)